MTQGRTDFLTIDGCLPRQDDDHQLEALVGVLEVPEHGLHAVRSLGILTEARLTLDGHPCIPRDLPQLICECSETDEELVHCYVIMRCSCSGCKRR